MKLRKFLPFSLNQNQSVHPKRARVPNVNGTKSYIRNFMVSYNILISSVYALYSIFKEEIPDFRYNKVSTSVNLQEITLTKFRLYVLNANVIMVTVTKEIAGSSVYSG